MPRPSNREAILDAAEVIVGRRGAMHLTLEAAAAQAGVSKGGLLYHFATKDALLEAMLERLIKRHHSDQAAERARLPDAPAADLEACVRAAFGGSKEPRPVIAGLLAAAASNPRLLKPVRRMHERQFRDFTRSAREADQVRLLLLALDGLWLNELLQTSPLTATQRRTLEKACVRLAVASV